MLYIIYILFTLSGFIALTYESVWSRYLKIFLGHSSYGQLLTLCIFMGGLGIGALIAGSFIKRIKRPLYFYAVLELFIGLTGLLYHKGYLLITGCFYSLGSSFSFPPLVSDVLKVGLSILITGPPAILIGMTFPVLAVGLMRLVQDRGKSTLSGLYFTNALGAAVGIMAASYLLIPGLGTAGSLYLAGVGNLFLALCFLLISVSVRGEISGYSFQADSPPPELDTCPYPRYVVLIFISLSFLTGFASFIYEIGWLRLTGLLMGSSNHTFDIMVSTFILGLAFGGLYAKRIIRRTKNFPYALATVQILIGASALISIYLTNPVFEMVRQSNLVLVRTETSYYIYSVFKYVLCLILMFPTGFFAGMTLPIITYYLTNVTRNEGYTGSVYGWNTMGSILGAALGGLLILPLLQLKFTIAAAAFIDIALGLILLELYKVGKMRRVLSWGLSVLIIVPVLFIGFDTFLITSGSFRGFVSRRPNNSIEVRHGKTSTVSLHKRDDRIIISTNGTPDAGISLTDTASPDEYTQAALAFIPMSGMREPYRVAVIGLGSGMTAHYLLGDPLLESLDLVEIEEEYYKMAEGFRPHNERIYTDDRIEYIFSDARTVFNTGREKYDIIVSELSQFWISGVSSLFTEEFYAGTSRSLKSGGILVQWLHVVEFNSPLMLSILKAIDSVFPYMKIYDARDNGSVVIIASGKDFVPDSYGRFRESEKILSDIGRFGDEINFFTNSNYIISGKSLTPILELSDPSSDFFPVEAEKSYFLKRKADLLEPFQDSMFYYQEVLEPELFSETLKEKLKEQARYVPDAFKIDYLLTLLKNAGPRSDWGSMERLFNEVVPERVLRGNWGSSEAVGLMKLHALEGTAPLDIRLKFIFLDNAINEIYEKLPDSIARIVDNFEEDWLSTGFIGALAIQSFKTGDNELLKKVMDKFVLNNNKISVEEKTLLRHMSEHINGTKPEI